MLAKFLSRSLVALVCATLLNSTSVMFALATFAAQSASCCDTGPEDVEVMAEVSLFIELLSGSILSLMFCALSTLLELLPLLQAANAQMHPINKILSNFFMIIF